MCPEPAEEALMNEQPKSNSGKWIAGAMIVVGLVMALSGWAVVYYRTRPVLDFFGPEAIAALQDPDDLFALRLIRNETESEIHFDGQSWAVMGRARVFAARGYTNARDALTKRETYVWDPSKVTDCEPEWSHALQLVKGDEKFFVLLCLDCPRVALVGRDGPTLVLQKDIAAGLEEILTAELGPDHEFPGDKREPYETTVPAPNSAGE